MCSTTNEEPELSIARCVPWLRNDKLLRCVVACEEEQQQQMREAETTGDIEQFHQSRLTTSGARDAFVPRVVSISQRCLNTPFY